MTEPPRKALGYVKKLRESTRSPMEKVAEIKGDLRIPTTYYHPDTPRGRGEKTDATRVATPEKRIPSASERLRETLAHKDEPVSKVARGSRQVAANKLADEVRKSRNK